ncbi:DUF6282 family protein [Peribacillus muralis]|uniref:DUF6282 family protein n=1 Tax=Peribacillus muralis TaxID=264697 RepID=UPI00366C1297
MVLKKFHPLLKGAIDFHVHSAPSIFERKQTDWQLIDEAIEAQMGGLVLKSHETSTVERAFLINEKVDRIQAFGGIVLNKHIGGWNPLAVETSLKLGGRVVWFPTLSSPQHMSYFANKKTALFNGNPLLNEQGLTLRNHHNEVYSEVIEILNLIKAYDAVLATGHLSLEEQHDLVALAMELGIQKIVIQHADMGISKIPLDDQKYFVDKGCIIEKCFLACSNDFHDLTVELMAETINELGADNCILVTDYGQPHNNTPVTAMNQFVEQLVSVKITEEQINKMLKVNPRTLLGVE